MRDDNSGCFAILAIIAVILAIRWMIQNWYTIIIIVAIGLAIGLAVLLTTALQGARERRRAEEAARLERHLQSITKRIAGITKQIADLSTKLKISFPEDYNPSIRAYVESHKTDLLINNTGLDLFVSSEIARANNDLSKLERAAKEFDEAMQLYSRTAFEVNRVGNKAFFHLLHQLLEGLEGLKTFLPRREWQKFYEGVDFAIGELKLLYENASSYEDVYEEEFEEAVSSDPFSILGVSQQMGDAQIRKIYLELCNIYHPDKGKVPDDTKFKEIQNAYEQISKMRQ